MANKVYIVDGGKKKPDGAANKSTQSRQAVSGGRAARPAARNREELIDRSEKVTHIEDPEIEKAARLILKKREKRRRIIVIACGALAIGSLILFTVNAILDYRKSQSYELLSNLREQGTIQNSDSRLIADNAQDEVKINYTDANANKIEAVVLPEYATMLAVNSKLIGWLKIENTTPSIDFPVMQTVDNEYYLNHDLNQNKDRNGSIFLDTNCDVLKPSTNFILYGHHMQSGNMFGNLDKYQDKSFYETHKYITFDTIYEYGTYEVMYVFRSHVFADDEIAFKYYQFYDAYSDVEFNSYMKEMADLSLYDTGVTAHYGDRLLTLSTCDYQEKNGRFVVVAKKIN